MEDKVMKEFKWISRDGTEHRVGDMRTHHLYYTVRMIWNHSAPSALKIRPYKKYSYFKKVYTNTYLKIAVKTILFELSHREITEVQQLAGLKHMMDAIIGGKYNVDLSNNIKHIQP